MGKRSAKVALTTLGMLSAVLGIAGIFLPLLPTTPFLLLATFCFARSSPRLYRRLVGNRWFGTYLRNYRERRGIPLRIKVLAISSLWITIAVSAIWATDHPAVRILLLAVAVAVTGHLSALKTLSREQTSGGDGE
jgi:hypothetical protein